MGSRDSEMGQIKSTPTEMLLSRVREYQERQMWYI